MRRDAEDNFYDRTEGVNQRQKRAAQPEALDAATLLGQKVLFGTCLCMLCCPVPCCAMLCCAVLCCAVLCCAMLLTCCSLPCTAMTCWHERHCCSLPLLSLCKHKTELSVAH